MACRGNEQTELLLGIKDIHTGNSIKDMQLSSKAVFLIEFEC